MRKPLLIVVLLLIRNYLIAMNHFIAPNGNNRNAGTLESPYATFLKAASVAIAGDTVFFRAGTYVSPDYISPCNSGTSGNMIVYSNYNNEVVRFNTTNATFAGIYFLNKSYIKLKGFSITHFSGTAKNQIQFFGCNHMVVEKCKTEGGTSGIFSEKEYGGSRIYGLTLKNCEFKNTTSASGILIGEMNTDVLIDSCKVSGAAVDGIYFYGNWTLGISEATAVAAGSQNVEVRYCEVSDNGRQGIEASCTSNFNFHHNSCHNNGASGIQIEDHCLNGIVQNNHSYSNARLSGGETGVWVDDARDITVRYNLLENNDYGFLATASHISNTNINVYYNIIINNNFRTIGGGIFWSKTTGTFSNNILAFNSASSNTARGAIWIVGSNNTVAIKNNIIYNENNSFDIRYDTISNVTLDYNIVYNSSRSVRIRYLGAEMSWDSWKSASGQDIHSLNLNPEFINPEYGNFKLKVISPSINNGINIGLTSDYLGNLIKRQPDIGAFEWE